MWVFHIQQCHYFAIRMVVHSLNVFYALYACCRILGWNKLENTHELMTSFYLVHSINQFLIGINLLTAIVFFIEKFHVQYTLRISCFIIEIEYFISINKNLVIDNEIWKWKDSECLQF